MTHASFFLTYRDTATNLHPLRDFEFNCETFSDTAFYDQYRIHV